ncbi:MAG TPA: sulfite exporter TauE/SafE family protein, partial [Novosphingobium sp.]|nr:sulfite exporter TauE/SafE family protein [Novosphingobium sp.]
MTFAGLGLMGGLALGLASSLHCLGMCGGIVSSLMLAGGGRRAPGWAGRLARLQGGRVLAYSLLGALCGGLGGAVFGHLAGPVLFLVLRSVAALSLGWVGLTLTGLAPRVPLAERGLALGAAGLRRVQALVPAVLAPVLTGMIWGLMPCGMVYG